MPQDRRLPLEELAASSPVAGVAEVVRIDVRRDPDTGAIYTDAHLRIREAWSAACPAAAVLTQVGGELDGHRSALPGGNWTLAAGESIVLFAKPWKGPYVAVTGRRQGLGRIDARGRVTWDLDRDVDAPRPSLDEIRTQVGKALGRSLVVPPATAPAATEGVEIPPVPPRPSKRELEGRGGLPFFLVAALLALAALALRLRRRIS